MALYWTILLNDLFIFYYFILKAKFEAEMREKGRLSQTESEEEVEEEDVKKKAGNKKKSTTSGRGATAVETGGKKRGKKDAQAGNATTVEDDKKKSKKKSSGKKSADAPAKESSILLPVPQEVLDMPVDPNEPTYCICQQVRKSA